MLRIEDEYTESQGADANYPEGSFKNVSSPGGTDGTPFEKAWPNDIQGFFQSLIDKAGITPSGVPDTVLVSDILNALKFVAGKNLYSATINYEVNGNCQGSDGIEYKAAIANGPATSVVNPVGDGTGTWKVSKSIVQTVSVQDGALATGTTQVPNDDTIPQITEGDEYLTAAITPVSAINLLDFDVVINGSHSAIGVLICSLFKDSGVDSIGTIAEFRSTTNDHANMKFSVLGIVAGGTSAITFSVRMGSSTAGTFSFNGRSGARKFGGVMASSIKITERTP